MRHVRNIRSVDPSAQVTVASRERPVDLEPEWGHAVSLDAGLELQPQAVILANPSPWHLEAALKALDQGCHVFIEKPLAPTTEGLDKLLPEARARNRVVMVGYNLRHHGCIRRMKTLIEEGAIGRVLSCIFEVGQFLPDWRPGLDYRMSVSAQRALGGGALLELSHEIDACIWLGGRCTEVVATLGSTGKLDLDVEDNARLLLKLSSGATGFIHMDFLQRPGGRRHRIIGTEGTLEWHSPDATVHHVMWPAGKSVALECPEARDPNHSYRAEIEEFIRRINDHDVSPGADFLSALHVVSIVEACRQSAASGLQVHV